MSYPWNRMILMNWKKDFISEYNDQEKTIFNEFYNKIYDKHYFVKVKRICEFNKKYPDIY
jgi:hypothetical protein